MSMLTIQDTFLFCNIVKALSNCTTLSFKITQDSLCIFSHTNAQYFISLPNTYYKITKAKNFSVHTETMIGIIDLLQKSVVVDLTNSFVVKQKIRNTQICINIPFVTFVDFIQPDLCEIETKLLINKSKIFTPFTGIVTYKSSNKNNLIVKRECDEMNEELIIYDIDFIEQKKLNFTCNNDWLQTLNILENEYENALFSFCEYFLSVQLIFSKLENSFFEIHIPRTLIL